MTRELAERLRRLDDPRLMVSRDVLLKIIAALRVGICEKCSERVGQLISEGQSDDVHRD